MIRLEIMLAVVVTVLAVLAAGMTPAVLAQTDQAKIAPALRGTLAVLQPGEMTTVIVTLKERPDLGGLMDLERAKRPGRLVAALRLQSEESQAVIRSFLDLWRSRGGVRELVPLWIVNGFAVTATKGVIQWIAARPEVMRVTADISVAAPNPPSNPYSLETAPSEPNIALIHAPALWAMGYRGAGVVVANMDTGVDITHPDLRARWRGGNNSWYDPNGEHPDTPTDLYGHGTWTMSIMVGGTAGGTAIGVAPEAQWIAVKIFNDSGYATISKIHQGFQWLLDPDGNPETPDAPDVVSNSWAFEDLGCDGEFQPDLQALRAAGILPIFAAGNSGPAAETSCSPANCPEALSVGATDNYDRLYVYSSRGPSACSGAPTIYPDIVAPGRLILAADPGGGYRQVTGTSMAAPHVGGALALLLCAYPGLSVEQQRAALIATCQDLGKAGPDNDYGYGRLDVLAAYQWLGRYATSQGDRIYLPIVAIP